MATLDPKRQSQLTPPEEAKAQFEAGHIRLPDDLIAAEPELPHSHDPDPSAAERRLEGKASTANLSQWQLITRRFSKHRLAVASLFLLMVLYSLALFAEFAAPYTRSWNNVGMIYAPPQLPKFSMGDGLYVDRLERRVDPITLRNYYLKTSGVTQLGFFVKGEPYKMWGFIPSTRHLFGVRDAASNTIDHPNTFYFLGADKYGRDILSRLIYGARISLSIGIVSIIATFLLGVSIGGVSGYVGGGTDSFIQRVIEVINSFPHLPLWLAFAAVLPSDWSPVQTYFAITIVLSLLSWTGLARVVRGKILSLREEDYAVAARLMGASHSRIIFRHLLPGFTSHIIVSLSLSVPGMILGETALSFLGLGLRPPVVSWGVMLQECLNIDVVANYPWLLMPVMMIVLTVLAFNFFGDGMRDARRPLRFTMKFGTSQNTKAPKTDHSKVEPSHGTLPVLEIENLQTHFFTDEGTIAAVNGVTVSLERGKVLALVGESGCGKSVTSYSILRLIRPPGKIVGGKILFRPKNGNPVDIATLNEKSPELYQVRGGNISMIFQEPMTALSPVHTVNNQISEAILLHQDVTPKQARELAIEMLRKVGIPGAERRIDQYPHEMSGGMRQRVVIAMALVCNPEVLIADEPTTALDVTIQAQILRLIKDLQTERGTSVVFITHDLGVVAQIADDVAVMYVGRVVEKADVRSVLKTPLHPYTMGLLESLPSNSSKGDRLPAIKGSVPSLTAIPPGCPFHPRCPHAVPGLCDVGGPPQLRTFTGGQQAACLRVEEIHPGVHEEELAMVSR